MKRLSTFLLILISIVAFAEVTVDVNLDIKHTLGSIDTLDRCKFINIHADIEEDEWEDRLNAEDDFRDHFLNGYDVYMGRNTGGITWYLNNQVGEDPNRPGFADSTDVASIGSSLVAQYASKTDLHVYEKHNDQILCAQLHPFYPDGQTMSGEGWAFSQTDTEAEPFGTATGEYMAHWIEHAYGKGGTTGQPTPKYCEIINEPVWHLVDENNTTTLEDIFKFHNGVAAQIKKKHPEMQVGGFCTAFPDFEKNDFQQWENRWKLFIDMCGENMDFFTIHLYDFPAFGQYEQYRKGSNMEATFDMMEQYSYLTLGEVKPIMISEFGAQMHNLMGAWSSERDWLHMQSCNSMMLQFMERANHINKALNFLPLKAEWGTTAFDDTYNHRLFRRQDEPYSLSGNWIYSDMVKLFQLWSNVKGTRVETKSDNIDILCDAYVDGNKAYIIINNLDFETQSVNVRTIVDGINTGANSINVKNLNYSRGTNLNDDDYTTIPNSISLKAGATAIIECTYNSDILISDSCNEVKYYADVYYQYISANAERTFNINGINKGSYGEAMLRVGIGRDHNKSKTPTITVNGTSISVPSNIRGGLQTDRDSYFGVLEIPVPYNVLQENNVVKVKFGDSGGYISTVTLQAYKFSRDIIRFDAVGLKDKPSTPAYHIYPIPVEAGSVLSVDVEGDVEISIFNLSGQVIASSTTPVISIKTPGIYTAIIASKEGVATQKIVVE